MAPHHAEHVPQANASPYKITAVADAGSSSMMTITIASPAGDKFKGFLVSARSPSEVGNSIGKNLGQFFPGDDGLSQTLTCNTTAVSAAAAAATAQSYALLLSLPISFSHSSLMLPFPCLSLSHLITHSRSLTQDAITHKSNDDKASVVFQWSPGDYSGDIVFA